MKITKTKLKQLIREELNTQQPNLEEAADTGLFGPKALAQATRLLNAAIDFAGGEGVPANDPQLLGYLQEALALIERGQKPDDWRSRSSFQL